MKNLKVWIISPSTVHENALVTVRVAQPNFSTIHLGTEKIYAFNGFHLSMKLNWEKFQGLLLNLMWFSMKFLQIWFWDFLYESLKLFEWLKQSKPKS